MAREWRDVLRERKEGWALDGKREWRDVVEERWDGVEECIHLGALWPKAKQRVGGWAQRLYSACLLLFLYFFLSS